MNTNLKLKFNITNGSTTKVVKVTSDLLLNPMYATEEDILTVFGESSKDKGNQARKSIFNASLTVLRLTRKIEKLKILSDIDLFHFRRDFAICLATNDMAKILNKELSDSISRSKTLGDFTVSTSHKSDNVVLKNILSDTSNCVLEFKLLIEDTEMERVLPSTFVKSISNITSRTSDKIWWNSNLPPIRDAFASEKYIYNGNTYKAGSFNIKEYQRFRGNDYVPIS